jgi:hypothetical protein
MNKTKLSNVPEIFVEYLNNINPNDLNKSSIVLTNGTWDIYLDYTGTDYESALGSIRNLANYRKKLLMEVVYSESITEIMNTSRNLSDYLNRVSGEFTVSVGSRKSYFLNWALRARLFIQNFF